MRTLLSRFFGPAVTTNSPTASTLARAGAARGGGMPAIEPLESRQMLAVVVWDGGPTGTATDFNTAANWAGDVLPGPADTALINTAGSTIVFSSGTRTITNLETSRDIQFNGGSLVTSGTNTITAVMRMQGGTLNGGTWNLSGFGAFNFTGSGGTFANLTTTSEIILGVANSTITLSGTTSTGTVRLSGNGTNLSLAPGYVLNHSVVAEGAGTSTRSITFGFGGAGAGTIGASAVVTLAASSGSGLILQQSSLATLTNNGLVVNENSAQTLTVSVPTFNNAGTLRATTGILNVGSSTSWTNTGTINAAATGVVNLGGAFNTTAGEGTFTTSAGQLNLTGTLTNTGNIFDLSPATTGNLRLVSGSFNNGQISATGGAVINSTTGNVTLANVAITGDILMSVTGAQLTLSGATTFTTLRMAAGNSTLYTAPGYTITNAIIGEGVGTGTRDIYVAVGGAGTTTISSTGSVTAAAGIGADVRLVQSSAGVLVNNGLIVNQAAGKNIQIISLNTFTNAATGVVRATAGGVSIAANAWTNAGTLENAAGSSISLGGTFNATGGIGTMNTAAGDVFVTGTVNNAGSTITLDATIGDWTMQGGTISGGSMVLNGFALATTTSSGTLAGVAITGEVLMSVSSAQLALSGNTTFTALRMSGSNTTLYTAPGYTLSSPIFGEGAATGTRDIYVAFGATGTTTISSTGSITAVNGLGTNVRILQSSAGTLVNNGLIVNQAVGRLVQFTNLATFTNGTTGTVRASAGNIEILATTWTNAGTLENAAGTSISLGGTFNATGGIGTFNTAPGNVLITGTVNNAGSSITLNATTGDWTMQGGTISGGSMVLNGVPLNTTSSSGTLASVAITGEVILGVTSAGINLSGTTTFTALRMSGGSSTLYTTPGYVLSSPVIAEGAATGSRDIYVAFGGAGTTTISSTGSITAVNGLGANVRILQSSTGTLVNNGLIENQAVGRLVQITNLATFTNGATGIVRASAGNIEILATNWTNAGTLENTTGTSISLGGTFNATGGIGTFNTAAGNVLVTGTVNNTGSTITLNATTGDWTMQGGTISGGSMVLNGLALNTTSSNGTLASVAITGEVILGVTSAQLILSGNTSFTALRMSGGSSTLYTTPGYTLSNPIIGEGAATGTRDIYIAFGGTGTTTISSTGSITSASGIGADVRIFQSSTGTLVNEGLITNQATGRNLQIFSMNTFTNNATGIVRSGLGTVTIATTTWTNAGSLQISNGASMVFGGTWNTTGGEGTVANAGGTVFIDGTISNLGNTIELNSATGSWVLRGGNISNGAMIFSNGSAILGSTSLGFLRNVAITGELNLSVTNTNLGIGGTTTFTIFRLTSGASNLYVEPGTTIASPIVSEGVATGTRSIVMNYGGSGAIIIAPAGSVRNLTGAGGDLNITQSSAMNVTNNGVISSEATGRNLLVQGTNFANGSTGQLNSSGGTLRLNISGGFTNAGTINATDGGIISLDGLFNAAGGIGTFNTAAGVVNITGTVQNAGNTITTTAATGSFNVINGSIVGGTITLLNGTTLNVPGGFSIINALVVDGDLVLSGGGNLQVVGTTTFTTARLTGTGGLYFPPGSVLNSAVTIEGPAAGVRNFVVGYGGTGTFTLGPSGSIRILAGAGGGVSITQSSVVTGFINNGLMSSEAVGRTFQVTLPTFTNNATLRAVGGTFDLNITAQFVNTATMDVGSGGLFRIINASGFFNDNTGTINITLGGPATSQYGRVQTTSGNMILAGTLNLAIANNVTLPIVSTYNLFSVPSNRTISGNFTTINQPPAGVDGKTFFLISPTVYTYAYSSLADFNSDAVVDLFDYLDFVAAFAANDPTADFNNDSSIDFFDYLDFLVIFSRF